MSATANAPIVAASDNIVSWPVKASTKLFTGEMVEKVIGYADSMAISNRGLSAVWGEVQAEVDNSSGSAGDLNVQVRTGKFRRQITLTNVTEYMAGLIVYLTDENTFTLGVTRNPVGTVVQYVTTSTAIVEFDTNMVLSTRAGLYFNDFSHYVSTEFTKTDINTAGTVAADITGTYGSLLITPAAADTCGEELQVPGSSFLCTAAKPMVFGISITQLDATQSAFLFGLCDVDTSLVTGVSDGIFLTSADAAATCILSVAIGSSQTNSSSIGTLVDGTQVDLSFVYDGSTKIIPYVNGAEGTAIAVTKLPAGVALTPSIGYVTGEAVANTCLIKQVIAQQVG